MVSKQQEKGGAEVQRLKELLVTAGRILENEGVYDYIGHVSARIPGTDRVLITPHLRELSFREVTPRDILTLDLKGNQLEGSLKHPSEIWIHLGIYKARPDVYSIVHVHPETCVAMSIAEVQLLPLYVTAGVFAKGVPIFKIPSLIITEELGDELAKTLGDCNAALLKWHGTVTVAATIEEACMVTIALERLARIQAKALAIAGAKGIQAMPPSAQATDPVLLSASAGWRYCVSRLPK